RQVVAACIHCAGTHNNLPSGGWGWFWVGHPDAGFGRHQPAGWAYSILPFIDQANLHDVAKGGTNAQIQAAMAQLVAAPLPLLNCPNRRNYGPFKNYYGYTYYFANSTAPLLARTDYAINAGDQNVNQYFAGPGSWMPAPSDDAWTGWHDTSGLTGVSFERSEIRISQIDKGTSQTLLVAEKYLNPDHYYTGEDGADNECQYTGFNNDNFRVTYDLPRRDQKGWTNYTIFGSSHQYGINVTFCDGSAKTIAWNVDPAVWKKYGRRME
ncbi:MAG: DUF1559 domain-containing protein, partial [Gemmataceae bacterium]